MKKTVGHKHKRRERAGVRSRSLSKWRQWGWVLVACVLVWGAMPVNAHAQGSMTIELADASKTVFGSTDCSGRTRVLAFLWSLNPESSTTLKPATEITLRVYLGDQSSGLKIAEVKRTVGPNDTTQLQQARYDGSINTAGSDSRKANGLEENDAMLHVADVIGYYRTKVNPENPAPSNFCSLETTPGNDEARRVTLTFVASYTVIKIDNTNPANPVTTETSQTATGTIEVQFDLQPPRAPTSLTTSALEKSVTVKWDGDSTNKHTVYYNKSSFDSNNLPTPRSQDQQVSATSHVLSGLEQNTSYYVAVRAYDAAGNPSALSPVVQAETKELTDFYEYYRNAGGSDKGYSGGVYCFIATAAYGHVDHSYVNVLRRFRDRFLLTNTPGRAFVAWYYRTSPAWAKWLRQSPVARKVVAVALYPLVGVAYVLLRPWLLVLLLVGVMLLWVGRRRWRKATIGAGALALLCAAPSNGWCEEATTASRFLSSPRNFGLEIRMGPYRPAIDSESGVQRPFENFFNNYYQPYLELGFEWMFFKKVGTLGLSASVGVSWASAAVLDAGGNRVTSSDTSPGTSNSTSTDTSASASASTNSTFWVIPLRLDLVYRFDYFLQRNGLPIVPYVRSGFDYFIWFVTDPSGSLASSNNDSAIGGRLGFHVSAGLMLELNFIDPIAARTFDVEVGVNHTFLFVEWNSSWVGIFSDGLNLSDHMVRAGLMFQF